MDFAPDADQAGSSEQIAEAIFQEASQAHQEGRLAEAEAAYRRLLVIEPGDAQAMHLLAAIVAARGEVAEAEGLLLRSIELDESDPCAWASWAFMAIRRNDAEAAVERLERAIRLDAGIRGVAGLLAGLLASRGEIARLDAALYRAISSPELSESDLAELEGPLQLLAPARVLELCSVRSAKFPGEVWWRACAARVHRRAGHDDAAIEILRGALSAGSDRASLAEMMIASQVAIGDDDGAAETVASHYGRIVESALAQIFADSGRPLVLWSGVCARSPELPGPWLHRARLEIGLGLLPDAERSLRHLLSLDPNNALALNNLAMLRSMAGDEDEAMTLLERAVVSDPEFVEARINLGHRLHQGGHGDRAHSVLRGSGTGTSDDLRLRLGSAIARLKIAWESEADLVAGRDAYLADLASIEEDLARDRIRSPRADTAEPLSLTPFYVAYLGLDDVPPQAAFGRIMKRLAESWLGSAATLDPPDPPAQGERVRVGLLSSHFHEHSVWKVITRGWVEGLDPGRFELFGYATGHVRDRVSSEAIARFSGFHHAAASSREWVARIRRDRLHVLLIPEIGMEARSVLLAATRLAPVQAASWGHSITSGLSSVDWFLGSELMEPEGAQCNYTERLQLLPGLSVSLRPAEVRPQGRSRAELGFEDDEVVYWCCQSVFKYLPRHDHVFAEIAGAVPKARFAFLESRRHPGAMRIFKTRLERGFQRAGLSAEAHCRFLPQHASGPEDVFGDCCRHADVFLDCPDWSGCNTTLESMTFGMPVVTMPGRTMRTRQSTGILRMMGLEETVAPNVDSFIEVAARLGRDRAMRQELRRTIVERRTLLYGDRAPLDALASWIDRVARASG